LIDFSFVIIFCSKTVSLFKSPIVIIINLWSNEVTEKGENTNQMKQETVGIKMIKIIKMLKRTLYTSFALPMSFVFFKAFWW